MARRSPDDYSNSSDDRSRDLTAQFWGKSPSWRTTGTYRRVTSQRRPHWSSCTRTRRHGDPTGQIPVVPAVPEVEEPLIDPYDFGFDDVGYGPDQGIAGKRTDGRGPTNFAGSSRNQPQRVEQIELEEHRAGGSRDPVSTLAQRLGLGAVDPLLLRLGVIVMIGVLLVPLAMSLRPASNKASVRTEIVSDPTVHLIAPGESAVGENTPEGDVVGSAVAATPAADAASAVQSSDATASAPSTSVAAANPDTAGVGDVTESAGDAASNTASAAASNSVEAVQPTQAMTSTGSGTAAAVESATPGRARLSASVHRRRR